MPGSVLLSGDTQKGLVIFSASGRQIIRKNNIRLDWPSQRIMFGFA
ncbi:MAG: hypothetical protein GW850_01920 [Sphingomonadales bacterium]|nr:hypothetical protein [Sphingomonadales bacterium]NCP27139.1 hypothetical protein [Sphingomonadales bacterium]NCP47939.1 hypothetical protein [Sphingomonadales bacterium]